jgi:acetyl esterase/lipase
MPEAFFNLPDADRRRLLDMGPVWARDVQGHRELVFAAYRPLLERAPKSGVEIARDLAYGAHSRQVLDVYRPAGAERAPIVLYVHGGAFVRGEKDSTPEIYANVCHYFARHGCVTLNVEYRLADAAPYPGGGEDVGAAVAWARAHAPRFGGDPARLVLVGHSAGGTHVGTYAFDPALASDLTGVRGLIFISARLRADVHADNPNAEAVQRYFGRDSASYDARSPVTHAAASTLPVQIAVAEYDNPWLDVYGAELAHRLGVARRRLPELVYVPAHNHISIIAHLNTEDDAFGASLRRFLARHA